LEIIGASSRPRSWTACDGSLCPADAATESGAAERAIEAMALGHLA